MAFLAFEGMDGAGKSSLISLLEKELQNRGLRFVKTREPGGTPLAEEIRQMLLKKTGDTPTPRAELLLYEAGRAQHVDQVIKPALKAGHWVLCDRFAASSLAFQCGGRGLPRDMVDTFNVFATDGVMPDLNILLDVPVETGLDRMNLRKELDRFESEKKDFHERVRRFYLSEAERDPSVWHVIDSSQGTPQDSFKHLLELLKEKKWLD